jgi:hypothetical protein
LITRERLLEFCEKHKIEVLNKKASLRELQALIARWVLDNETVNRKSCFGLLDTDDNNCLSCDFRAACFKLSFGTDEETYWKRIEKADKPKVEF